VRDDVLEQREEREPLRVGRNRIGEARLGALVAGGSERVGQHEDRVGVAVRADVDDVEEMTRGFALGPKLLPRAAEEHHATTRERLAQGVLVHVAEHQHAAGDRVLHDGWQQPVALVPGQRVDLVERHSLTSICCSRR